MIEGSKDKWEEGQRRGDIERVKGRKEKGGSEKGNKKVYMYIILFIISFFNSFIFLISYFILFSFILFYLSLI